MNERRRMLVTLGGEEDLGYRGQYFTLKALEDGTFNHTNFNVDYSVDNGNTWTTLSAGSSTPTIQAGTKVMFRGTITPTSSAGVGTFTGTNKFEAEGNPMSLLYGDDFMRKKNLTGKRNAFFKLFRDATRLQSAENLSLPATTLASYCYTSMFNGCTWLTKAPELPATTVAPHCYRYMFQDCKSLTTAPELPATTLSDYCYNSMFQDCKSLTTAPELPATTLAKYCYNNMFHGCKKLNYIKAMFRTTPSTTYTSSWVDGVASSGTFVKNAAAMWTTTGVNAVPSGWTIQTASS